MSNSSYIVTIASLLIAVFHVGCNIHHVNGFSVLIPYSNHPRQIVSTTGTTTTLFAKRVSFKENARRGLVSGINQVADAVRVTLGPKVILKSVVHSFDMKIQKTFAV
jgi:hypothetical protein